jgi:hypothetical protein
LINLIFDLLFGSFWQHRNRAAVPPEATFKLGDLVAQIGRKISRPNLSIKFRFLILAWPARISDTIAEPFHIRETVANRRA